MRASEPNCLENGKINVAQPKFTRAFMGSCALPVFTCCLILLCTTTNASPYERFLNFHRRSMFGRSLPNWLLQPGPYVRRFVQTKNQPLVDVVELIEANHNFAIIKFPDGRESTISVTDLASSP